MKFDFEKLLSLLTESGGSDLLLITSYHPRIKGKIGTIEEQSAWNVLVGDDIQRTLQALAGKEAVAHFLAQKEYELGFERAGLGRFRATFYMTLDGPALAVRHIPFSIPSASTLAIPQHIQDLALLPDGLILITGPNGHGKSTTLASLVEHINAHRHVHIVTIEDPIEFVFHPHKSTFSQRSVGVHTHSFPAAIRHTLRQAVDVIMIGELRDHETIATALTLAETGHLVLATLHTQDAPRTVQRIIDVFPPEQQGQIALQLAESLTAIVSQRLVARADGQGRVAAREILIANDGVRNAIRTKRLGELYSQIQINRAAGMISFDESLSQLVRDKVITREEALHHAHDREWLKKVVG